MAISVIEQFGLKKLCCTLIITKLSKGKKNDLNLIRKAINSYHNQKMFSLPEQGKVKSVSSHTYICTQQTQTPSTRSTTGVRLPKMYYLYVNVYTRNINAQIYVYKYIVLYQY